MNRFKKLTDKLVKMPLWSNLVTVIELDQEKDEKGRIIYTDGHSMQMKCIKKNLERLLENNIFVNLTEFYFSMLEMESFDLNKKFVIVYNGERFSVDKVIKLASIGNEDAMVKMVVIK